MIAARKTARVPRKDARLVRRAAGRLAAVSVVVGEGEFAGIADWGVHVCRFALFAARGRCRLDRTGPGVTLGGLSVMAVVGNSSSRRRE